VKREGSEDRVKREHGEDRAKREDSEDVDQPQSPTHPRSSSKQWRPQTIDSKAIKKEQSADPGSDSAESFTMSENAPPATAIGTDDDPTRGMPYHDKVTQDLKALLQKKHMLERTVMQQEETIYKKETEYLEETPHGNILTGFENYIKGSSSSAPGGGRRKAGITDADRVFSRSSLRYNDTIDSPGLSSSHTTPNNAPTPVNTSFLKEGTSNNATPTSATSANKSGAGLKKANKRVGEDSETDSKESKKVRTNFGASRK